MLALGLARTCERVDAVDVNPRAVACTRLSAALSGCTTITAHAGSWFEPVAGRAFDRIASNAPYVVSPDRGLMFRDSGRPEGVAMWLVGEAARRLTPAGVALLALSWPRAGAEAWSAPARRWAQAAGCDALALLSEDSAAEKYAEHWTEGLEPAERVATVRRWTDHYARIGAERLTVAVVALRRAPRGRQPAFLARVPRAQPEVGAGQTVMRMLDGIVLARDLTDGALLGGVFEAPSSPPSTGAVLRLHEAIGHLFDACRDGRPLATCVPSVAATAGVAPATAERAVVAAARRLLAHGLLVSR